MNLINEQVEHSAFGIGRIINLDNNIISIQFSEKTGLKRFLYPDAFDKYLTMCNPAVAESVLADLKIKMEEIKVEELRKKQEYEEELERIELERAASVAKKKKSTPKTKKATATKKASTTKVSSEAAVK